MVTNYLDNYKQASTEGRGVGEKKTAVEQEAANPKSATTNVAESIALLQ